ncbi:MAG TPA: HAD family hydrolase [Gaiellales bacterium]
MKALLLDLDDTLIPDYAGFLAAVDDCAAALGGPSGMGAVLHARARVRWGQAPDAAALEMRDMSSWEALWAPFPVGTEAWADGFRLGAWHEALADHGVDDHELADRLARAYREHRHALCRPYPETVAVLESLRGRMRLAVVTNGTEEHQRTKLDASGLTEHFDAIVTSGAVGASKPDPAIFRAALDAVGCSPEDAVMVGDNPLRDIAGAQQAGLRGVWIDRDGGNARGVVPDARIRELGELAALGWW